MTEENPLDDLDVPEDPTADLDRTTQTLQVRTEERRYGKQMVIVDGLDSDEEMESLASELKSMLGTGGTVKDGHIEIQGDHESRIRSLLHEKGYQLR
ncbi:translation initiation factor [Halapricum desulfuricans]|uniref:Protein translation factor SUI1 homolog n=1 Tax=Halapricum desulfuricans TaxID=2841257 RepID=A0A897N153_9EURY|nr:translation initiation factor [Halapricum desulfuricans]QSG06437.1 Translation initiation factor 1 (eIF-1/SUI1) [Halapricum desulfuricans]